MDDSFIGFFQDIFNELRRLPLFNDHYDKLFVILGVLLLLYFVGSLARNVALRGSWSFSSCGVFVIRTWVIPGTSIGTRALSVT